MVGCKESEKVPNEPCLSGPDPGNKGWDSDSESESSAMQQKILPRARRTGPVRVDGIALCEEIGVAVERFARARMITSCQRAATVQEGSILRGAAPRPRFSFQFQICTFARGCLFIWGKIQNPRQGSLTAILGARPRVEQLHSLAERSCWCRILPCWWGNVAPNTE